MQMKKRVLSVLLALCLAGSLASTAWAAGDQATPETADADTSAVVLNEEEEQQDETTASQEETSGEDSTAAPAEDPVAEVTENEADDGSVEYTAALETDGQTMNVVVTAPEGAFAENVQPELSVTMLTAEDELNAVADKLDTAEVQYDGFTALDITFTDKATGEEIEPAQQVSVRIELPKAIVDSGIDLNTLAVQHLEEDENGDVQNVTEVATLDNGITLSEEAAAAANEAAGVAPMSDMPAEEAAGDAAETPAAVAEFEVDGFSSFVITWEEGWTTYFEVTVHYVDEGGNDIQGTRSWNDSISDEDTIYINEYAGNIVGYTYQEAHYGDVNGYVVTKVTASESGFLSKTRTLTFYNDSTQVAELKYDKNSHSAKTENIYLVYKADETTEPGGDEGDTTVTNATVTTTKTAYLRDDDSGNYDLTLSISGDRGSSSKKQKVDILFILDKSGSMDYALDKDDDAEWWESSRMDLLQQAVGSLVDTIARNESIDARYGAVAFARSQQRQTKSWTDASSIKSFVNELDPNGGTNYQQGIYDGKQLLNNKRADALTFVIFVSDGEPTYRGINVTNSTDGSDYSENGTGNGQNDSKGYNIAAAVQEISNMACDYFYAIGMGPEFGHDWWGDDKTGTENLKKLANAVQATSKGDNNVFSASATDTLEQAFKDIAASVTFFAATDVTITDPLSEYADLVLTNEAPQFTITVTREASEEVTAQTWKTDQPVGNNGSLTFTALDNSQVTVTAQYDPGNKTIALDFPDDYELEPGYTYSISTVITPSQTALTAGMDSDKAKQTPDVGTGTHADANQQGFWSNDNDNAKVTFTANGEPGSENFPKPVIQVPEITTGSLSLTKQLAEASQALVPADTEFSFIISIPAGENDANAKTYNASYTMAEGSEQTPHSDDVTFSKAENTDVATATVTLYAGETVIISDLPEVDVTINETTLGYEADWEDAEKTNTGCTVAINSDQPAVVTCTNTLQTGSLKIDKNIAGLPGGTTVTDQTYTFNIDGPDTLTATIDGVTFTNGNAIVTINNDGQKTITGLPKASYTITETTPNLDITVGTGDSEQQYYFADVAYGNNSSGEPNYDVDSATVDLTDETSATVTVTNKYEPYKTVIITKVVDNGAEADIGMGDRTKLFAFTTQVNSIDVTSNTENVTLTTLDDPEDENDAFNAAWTQDGYSLAHGGTLRIEKLKATDVVSFTESDYTGEGYTTSYTVSAGNRPIGDTQTGGRGAVDLDSNVYADYNEITVTVTNNRKVVAPTGLESNHTTPYTLMVTAAGIAGLALIGGIVVRRRRRRME